MKYTANLIRSRKTFSWNPVFIGYYFQCISVSFVPHFPRYSYFSIFMFQAVPGVVCFALTPATFWWPVNLLPVSHSCDILPCFLLVGIVLCAGWCLPECDAVWSGRCVSPFQMNFVPWIQHGALQRFESHHGQEILFPKTSGPTLVRSLLLNGYRGYFPEVKRPGLMLTTPLHLVPGLRKSGSVGTSAPPCMPSWRGRVRYCFYFWCISTRLHGVIILLFTALRVPERRTYRSKMAVWIPHTK